MDNSDKPKFAAIMTGLAELYDKAITQHAIGIYWDDLSFYDFAAFDEAVKVHRRNPESGRFMPKPADLIKIIEGGTADKALIAWSKVNLAVRTIGPYQTVVFDDPLIHAVVTEMGGWVKLCDCESKEMQFKQNEFANRYRGYASRQMIPAHPPALMGEAEHYNRAHGHNFVPKPQFIGNEQAARAVLTGSTAKSIGRENGPMDIKSLAAGMLKKV